MLRKYRLALWLLLAFSVTQVGCVELWGPGASGNAGPETAQTPMQAALRASCNRSCNRSYDICSDGSGFQRGGGSGYFGAGAACDRQLSSCLNQCKAQAAQAKPKAKDGENPLVDMP